MTARTRARRRERRGHDEGSVATPSGSVHGVCRWCKVPVLWLAHVRTGHVQPINPLPEPDGNIRVLLGGDGRPSGLYVVVPKRDWAVYDGQLHTPHVSSCSNATARRLMRERARERGSDVDGDAPRAAAVPCAAPGCPYPLDPVVLQAGWRFHPTCDPDTSWARERRGQGRG